MMRISRMFSVAWLAVLPLVSIPATIAHAQTALVPEKTSSALLTFSDRDRAIRVAIVFVDQDDATVDTLVRFVDARGNVLKEKRGNLSFGVPVVAELTRADVGNRPDVLVRAEVYHLLPGKRLVRYPIVISLQPIAEDGSGRWEAAWPGGDCGCPTCSPPHTQGQHANCTALAFTM